MWESSQNALYACMKLWKNEERRRDVSIGHKVENSISSIIIAIEKHIYI